MYSESSLKNIKYVFFATNLMCLSLMPRTVQTKTKLRKRISHFLSLVTFFYSSTIAVALAHERSVLNAGVSACSLKIKIHLESDALCVWNLRIYDRKIKSKAKPTTTQRHNFRGFHLPRQMKFVRR